MSSTPTLARRIRCLALRPGWWLGWLLAGAGWLIVGVPSARPIGAPRLVDFESVRFGFPLVDSGRATPLWVDTDDFPGVRRAVGDFSADIARVSGRTPAILPGTTDLQGTVVMIGTLGKSRVLDGLVRAGRLDVAAIAGRWESFIIQVLPDPLPGVPRALVIAGSDKRGTIYGIYHLSEQIGVSPWYWWADVPADHHGTIFLRPGRFEQGPPAVRYRGIFLNDEAPDLTNWIRAKFGTLPPGASPPVPAGIAAYDHRFYERIFEVLLRLKANYLWPAMWNNAFNEDDPANPRLADEYGIVLGTSHQEPMLRAQKEWDRRYGATLGSWNYATQAGVLTAFWREGIRRHRAFESVVTLGLRGADDTPMAPGGPEANRAMLEEIVGVQRQILREELNPDLARVPQLWCLYKEVQDFYDAGLRVPEDVTLLWADDNWGNLRRVPTAAERNRPGGAGVYYHFDYHGGPRSYQWIGTNPLPKIWDQLSLAHQAGADRIWIVNVGHFKGYELPTEFFLTLAWDPGRWPADHLADFTRAWARREFGPPASDAIAELAARGLQGNGRRKPELLAPDTYSLTNYRESETNTQSWRALADQAAALEKTLPLARRDAFEELVGFPIRAAALVNELYAAAGRNAWYARQGRASTTELAQETRRLFEEDLGLMDYFNRQLAGGKWDHFMDQPHLGYTSWRDPPDNSLKAIPLVELPVAVAPALGVAVEGCEPAWPGGAGEPALPAFDAFNRQSHWVDVFNRGRTPLAFTATASTGWIKISERQGTVAPDRRLWISVDWHRAPRDSSHGEVIISGAGETVRIGVDAFSPREPTRKSLRGFVAGEGVVAMEAVHFTARLDAGERRWVTLPGYGRTLGGMRATAPLDLAAATPGIDAPCLEYRMYLFRPGPVEVTAIVGPTLNCLPGRPVRCAVSIDQEAPQVLTVVPAGYRVGSGNKDWEQTVADEARGIRSTHPVHGAGYHTLKFWMVDPGVVLEKLVVDLGGLRPSLLGPPESFSHGLPPERP